MLILAASPIGNLEDASERLRKTLANAAHIAAEDTRTLRRLAAGLGIKLQARLHSFHEHTADSALARLVQIAAESDLVLISDAGMPTLSDPGFELVRACVAAGVEVSVLPGPNAAVAAVAVSGLPTDRFCFEGFIGKTATARRRQFDSLRDETRTMIFYDSPQRIQATLQDAIRVFGANRGASVSRELTKRFEETARGNLEELAAWAGKEIRGEIVLVIAGIGGKKPPRSAMSEGELIAGLRELRIAGAPLRDAAAELSVTTGYSRNDLYKLGLKAKL